MNIFEYTNYKTYVNDWIRVQKSAGHGQLRKLSLHLGINSVVMSQVFRGARDLTVEQAVGVANYIGLSELSRDFFLLLVQKDRAGTHELKLIFDKQLETLHQTAQSLKNRVKHQKFNDEDKATFYSQWHYSAIRLGVSIPHLNSVSAIADHLIMDRNTTAKVLDFLLKNKLVVEKNGKLDIGPQVTHVGHDSEFVTRHHLNWRIKSLNSLGKVTDKELRYTGPMALSHAATAKIRKQLVELIEHATKIASESPSEELQCLTIDWFSI